MKAIKMVNVAPLGHVTASQFCGLKIYLLVMLGLTGSQIKAGVLS